MSLSFSAHILPIISITNGELFPVRRIFCVGKNYAEHVREMGGDAKKAVPVFFTKPADAVVENGTEIAFPQATENLHYEGELVVALQSGGRDITISNAMDHVFGYAAGCDLTRRDLQAAAKKAGNPWDVAKAFDHSAPIGTIQQSGRGFDLAAATIKTVVDGKERQCAPLSMMIWSVPEIITSLSSFFELKAGDLIFTGTPAGVGQLIPGNQVSVIIDGLPSLQFSISE